MVMSLGDTGRFVFEPDGFYYPFKKHVEKLNYVDIDRIVAYKLDLFTTDEICMDIFSGDWIITFSESLSGWHRLLENLSAAFPTIPENWDNQIMFPAFATNYTILFERVN
jgi:hypothetical protein